MAINKRFTTVMPDLAEGKVGFLVPKCILCRYIMKQSHSSIKGGLK